MCPIHKGTSVPFWELWLEMKQISYRRLKRNKNSHDFFLFWWSTHFIEEHVLSKSTIHTKLTSRKWYGLFIQWKHVSNTQRKTAYHKKFGDHLFFVCFFFWSLTSQMASILDHPWKRGSPSRGWKNVCCTDAILKNCLNRFPMALMVPWGGQPGDAK